MNGTTSHTLTHLCIEDEAVEVDPQLCLLMAQQIFESMRGQLGGLGFCASGEKDKRDVATNNSI
jgi:hypothetical protein